VQVSGQKPSRFQVIYQPNLRLEAKYGCGRLAESSTELASIIDFFGSRFDQAKISVARTALEAEDARERAEIRMASFPLKNDLLSRNKEACGSCVEPSSLKNFG
jgi:hypothetical protein